MISMTVMMMMMMMMMMMSLRSQHGQYKAQEAVYFLPTTFVKHFPGQLLVGLMVEEGKGHPVILTKGRLEKKCFKLLIV